MPAQLSSPTPAPAETTGPAELDGQRTAKQVAYGITSLSPEAADAANLAADQRGHWNIENRTHYVRDVTFHEDHSQQTCRDPGTERPGVTRCSHR